MPALGGLLRQIYAIPTEELIAATRAQPLYRQDPQTVLPVCRCCALSANGLESSGSESLAREAALRLAGALLLVEQVLRQAAEAQISKADLVVVDVASWEACTEAGAVA